jgi:arginine:pyruvate transaminase
VTGTGLSGAEFVAALYRTQRVSVMDGGAFGASTAGCVRVCFAIDEATLDRTCERLQQFCENLRTNGTARAAAAQRTP